MSAPPPDAAMTADRLAYLRRTARVLHMDEYDELLAEVDRLRAALADAEADTKRLLIGGNHLAVALGQLLPGQQWESWTRAQVDGMAYDAWREVWVAWRIAMDVSESRAALATSTETGA